MRRLARLGLSTLTLLALIVLASAGLWIGIPLGWLWIGSRIQAATGNLGAAIGAMIFGVVATVAAAIPLLTWLTRLYQRTRTARGLEDTGTFPLEAALVCTATIALVAFTVWFFFFSGAAPFPVPER